jgi:uncharacterized pyridoxamine 5'-phosphate oxidase family protein
MAVQLDKSVVWRELENELFAVLGMVNARNEARTAGIVYIVHGNKFYISTGNKSWKAHHIRGNPNISVTIPIAKRIPFLPWIKIPAATITFSGKATVFEPNMVDRDILHNLLRGMEEDLEKLADLCVIEVVPEGDFITYGIGIRLMQMRDQELARGRAPVS